MKLLDKYNKIIKYNKKVIIFLSVLGIIAIISGSLFSVMLNNSDKELTINYVNGFFENIKSNNLDYLSALKNALISSNIYIIIVWLLGISIIGIPIILFMYFSKIFVLGFSVATIIKIYGFKGCFLSLSYIFPHHIINIIIYTILVLYSLKVAGKLLYSIFKSEKLDFKLIMNKYLKILLIVFIINILTSLYEVFISPYLIKIFLNIIK